MADAFDSYIASFEAAVWGEDVRQGLVDMAKGLHDDYKSLDGTRQKIADVEDDLEYVHSNLTSLQAANAEASGYVGPSGTLTTAITRAGSIQTALEDLSNDDGIVPYFVTGDVVASSGNYVFITTPAAKNPAGSYVFFRLLFLSRGGSGNFTIDSTGESHSVTLPGSDDSPVIGTLDLVQTGWKKSIRINNYDGFIEYSLPDDATQITMHFDGASNPGTLLSHVYAKEQPALLMINV